MLTIFSPLSLFSHGITQSAPSGITPPVIIFTAWDFPTVPSKGVPAKLSPITENFSPRALSSALKAYPSYGDLENGG